jgi:hypothetical protein
VKVVGPDLQRQSDSFSAFAGDLVALVFELNGGGAVIADALAADLPDLPFAGTIQRWTIVGDVTGSITIDVQKCTYAGFPTFSSVAGTAKPSLSGAQKAQNTSLTGWGSTGLAQGDLLRAVVSGAATNIKRATVTLWVKRSS